MQPSAVEGLYVLPAYKEMADFPLVVARITSAARTGSRSGSRPPRPPATTSSSSTRLRRWASPRATSSSPPPRWWCPWRLTYFALDGCAEVADTVRQVAETEGRPDLRITKVVPTLYRRTALATAILERLKAYFPVASRPRRSATTSRWTRRRATGRPSGSTPPGARRADARGHRRGDLRREREEARQEGAPRGVAGRLAGDGERRGRRRPSPALSRAGEGAGLLLLFSSSSSFFSSSSSRWVSDLHVAAQRRAGCP